MMSGGFSLSSISSTTKSTFTEDVPGQGGAAARGAALPSCSKSRLFGCLFFSENALRVLAESWKAGHSSLAPNTLGPKEMTVMDYAFKVNSLAENLER
jgi:hypothetical protein